MKINLTEVGGEEGREDTQWYTQNLAASLLSVVTNQHQKLWLDIGAGLGLSKTRIEPHGFRCVTQDVAPGLPVDTNTPLDKLVGQFGVVSAFDVIEHIEENCLEGFLLKLKNKSKRFITVSAPYNAPSPYHFTVFSPQSLLSVTSVLGNLICAYDLHEGHVSREDFKIGKDGAFGGLLIFEK